MSEMDEKLNSILSNPQLMQQIMTLAQSMNQNTDSHNVKGEQPSPASSSEINTTILNRVSSIMQHGTIDRDQQSLLKALSPYLSPQKIRKLERAMHAAKMASIASEFVNTRNGAHYMGR